MLVFFGIVTGLVLAFGCAINSVFFKTATDKTWFISIITVALTLAVIYNTSIFMVCIVLTFLLCWIMIFNINNILELKINE